MIKKLLISLKRKNRKTQRDFYEKYSTGMFRLSYRYVNNEQDAGSIVNSAFHKIFINIGQINHVNEITLIAWMKRIVINEALMLLRSQSRYPEITNPEELIIADDEITDGQLLLEDYYTMIRNLTPELRTVFNMYAIDGFSHKEIAVQMNIKESSSRVYLSRARKFLQEMLTMGLLV